MENATEPHRGYPIPDRENKVSEEFPRSGDAVSLIGKDIADIFAALGGKAPLQHQHAFADIPGLQSALDGKLTRGDTFALDDLSDVDSAGAANYMVLASINGRWQPWVVAAVNISGLPSVIANTAIDASKITTGVLDPARIPVLQSQATIISAGAISALTSTQQGQIITGTHVTTTDGRRWIYTGAGSKTAEASYIELGDVTPEWSVIANKPTTFAVLTTGWADVGSVGRDLVASASQADGRAALGLGTAATLNVGLGANQIVQRDGSARYPAGDGSAITNAPGFRPPDLWVQDERATGTIGDNQTAGWTNATINTVKYNVIAGASVAGNIITLPAGRYYCRWSNPARLHSNASMQQNQKTRLRDTANNITLLVSANTSNIENTTGDTVSGNTSLGVGSFTLTATTTIALQRVVSNTGGGTWGTASGQGEIEIYAVIEIWKAP